jgi:hypothetical protein
MISGDMEKAINRAVRIPNATPEIMLAAMPFFNPDDPDTFAVWNRFAEKLQDAYKKVIALSVQTEMRRRGWSKKIDRAEIVQKVRVPKRVPSVPVNPASLEFMRTRSLRLAVELSSQTREVVTDILTEAFEEAIHPTQIVKKIKASVGLTSHMQQMKSVRSTRTNCASGERRLSQERRHWTRRRLVSKRRGPKRKTKG